MRDTDLRSIVETAVEAFEPVREHKNVEFDVGLPPESTMVRADRGAVADALFNLLTNAYKYGGDPPKIALFVEENAKEVKLTVRDNGSGIPATEHSAIFQRFYRVDDRLSREREGSGLGLAIVKHVMKAHQGRVELESSIGKGSSFSLVLPTLRQHRSSERRSSGPHKAAGAPS